jgi:predicted Zn-dependent protease
VTLAAAARFARAAAAGLAALAVALAPGAAAALTVVRDAEIEATLERLADPVLRAAGLPPGQVELVIVDDRQPNAFVFDGRHIVLTTGLMRRFGEPEQLQGVIAHEAGHLVGGHLARRHIAVKNAQGPALIGLVLGIAAAAASGSGGAGAAVAAGTQNAVLRGLLVNSRAEEASADQAALTYLERAGIDPSGLLAVMEDFRGQEVFTARNQDPYMRTHPMSADRLAMVERRSAESSHKGADPDPEAIYWSERMQAKLAAFLDAPRTTLSRLDRDDDSEFARLKRAVALHRLPDPDAAAAEAERLIAMRPDDPFYHELKGQILLESGRGPEAVAAYRKAVSLAPREPLILGALGRALLALETPEADREAVSALERGAAESGGGSPALLRDLSYAYARIGEEGKAALAAAERLAMTGQPADARRLAARAKGLLPQGSPAWLRADDILVSLPSEG